MSSSSIGFVYGNAPLAHIHPASQSAHFHPNERGTQQTGYYSWLSREAYSPPMNWEDYHPHGLPSKEDMDETTADWLRPLEYDDRMDALAELLQNIDEQNQRATDREREMRREIQTKDIVEARMALLACSARLAHFRSNLTRHIGLHQWLPRLHRAPTCEQVQRLIEEFEDRLQLPVRSAFVGNYRVGWGNGHEHLARDPELGARAVRAEMRVLNAEVPDWEVRDLNLDLDSEVEVEMQTDQNDARQPMRRSSGREVRWQERLAEELGEESEDSSESELLSIEMSDEQSSVLLHSMRPDQLADGNDMAEFTQEVTQWFNEAHEEIARQYSQNLAWDEAFDGVPRVEQIEDIGAFAGQEIPGPVHEPSAPLRELGPVVYTSGYDGDNDVGRGLLDPGQPNTPN